MNSDSARNDDSPHTSGVRNKIDGRDRGCTVTGTACTESRSCSGRGRCSRSGDSVGGYHDSYNNNYQNNCDYGTKQNRHCSHDHQQNHSAFTCTKTNC